MDRPSGRRVVVEVDGRVITCTTIGGLAAAVGRSSATVRSWERSGLIPMAPIILPADDPRAMRRLYPLDLVESVRRTAISERFGRRRPPGHFARQRELLAQAWMPDDGSVTESADR